MDDKFEEQLSGLMQYRSDRPAPFTVGDVISGARRRSRTRALGVAGSALAVVAVGVGAAALAGGGPGGGTTVSTVAGATTTATTTTAAPAVTTTAAPAVTTTATTPSAPQSTTTSSPKTLGTSPVKTVRSGEKVTVVDGYQVWVTSHEKCESESAAFMGAPPAAGDNVVCKDVTGSNMAWDGKSNWLGVQSTGTKDRMVISGTFQGKTVPALIDVQQDGRHYAATILETAGMEHWAAYYVTFPLSVKQPATLGDMGYTVTAYDADGNALTQDPPMAPTK